MVMVVVVFVIVIALMLLAPVLAGWYAIGLVLGFAIAVVAVVSVVVVVAAEFVLTAQSMLVLVDAYAAGAFVVVVIEVVSVAAEVIVSVAVVPAFAGAVWDRLMADLVDYLRVPPSPPDCHVAAACLLHSHHLNALPVPIDTDWSLLPFLLAQASLFGPEVWSNWATVPSDPDELEADCGAG